MNTKFVTLLSAVCLVGMASLAVPVRADDEASNAVKQCFLDMKAVTSYRTKETVITLGYSQGDQSTITEYTKEPRRSHTIFTTAAGKYTLESVTSDNVVYSRTNDGPWQAQILTKASPAQESGSAVGSDGTKTQIHVTMPLDTAPWNSRWIQQYDPHAAYSYARRDMLDSIPVDVYSTTKVEHLKVTVTEVWIGVSDHLPHEILSHMTQTVQGEEFQNYTTETISDFNAPITITVPDIAPSDPSATEAQPSDNH